MDDYKAEKYASKTEDLEKSDALVAAGQNVRNMALSRSSSRLNSDIAGETMKTRAF